MAPSVTALNFTEFTGLGHIPDSIYIGVAFGGASDVSGDGSVIVGTESFSSGNTEAFYYTKDEGITGLGGFRGSNDPHSFANGISADGRVIVGGGTNGNFINESFRYTKSEGMIGIGVGHDVDLDGRSGATSASSDGSVIVGSTRASDGVFGDIFFDGQAGFRYTKSEGIDWIVDRASIGSNDSVRPLDISADGNVIVGGFDLGNKFVDGIFMEGNRGAFRYTTSEGLIEIENLDFANAISADDSVIVGSSNGEAVRYTNSGGIIRLGDLPAGVLDGELVSFAVDVSGDGSVIVGDVFEIDSGKGQAFIWDENSETMNSFYDALIADGLDLSEWSDLRISAISDDGSTIVGNGTHNGNIEAFAARMFVVPIPATIWLMASALLGLLGFQRKHNG